MKKNPQSGNVLFYILFAIALLAGLTFAVNRGGQVSTATLSADQARVAASEILDYAGAVSGAVTKLKLRGCTETQVSFENTATGATYTNGASPTDNSCRVFDPAGAQVNWIEPAIFNSAAIEFTGGCNVASVGTTSSELIMVIEDIDLTTCRQINERLGVAAIADAPVTLAATCDYAAFTGTYPATGTITVTGKLGRTAACVRGTGTADDLYQDKYHFYQVLLAR